MVSESDDRGVTGLRVDGIPVAKMLEQAVELMSWLSGQGTYQSRRDARTATRRRVSAGRLRQVAAAYERGGIEAVMEAEVVEERQAYRLLRRAREAGLVAGRDDEERD
jgi:hypothetical protein